MLPKIAHRAFETPPATLLYLELRQMTYACFKGMFQLYLYQRALANSMRL